MKRNTSLIMTWHFSFRNISLFDNEIKFFPFMLFSIHRQAEEAAISEGRWGMVAASTGGEGEWWGIFIFSFVLETKKHKIFYFISIPRNECRLITTFIYFLGKIFSRWRIGTTCTIILNGTPSNSNLKPAKSDLEPDDSAIIFWRLLFMQEIWLCEEPQTSTWREYKE